MIIADLTDPKNISEVTAGFVAFFVQFLPLIAVIFSLQMAGGLVGRIHQALSGQLSKAGAGIKGNPNDPNSFMNKSRRQAVSSLTRRQARTVDTGRAMGATRGQRFKARASRMAWRGVDERMSRLVKEDRERAEAVSATGRDGMRYAGGGWKLGANEQAPSFLPESNGNVTAGTTVPYDRYFDSKGKEIGVESYREGKSNYGNTREATANSLNYAAKKIQTDQDVANFRNAFTRNAVEQNWNNDEMGDAWATATYEYKPQLASEWYSRPKAVTGANGKTAGVQFKDIGNDIDSYHSFISEKHKTNEGYKLSSMRDSEFRAMGHVQSQLQTKIANGQSLTKKELESFAMTNEGIDTIVKDGYASGTMTRDADGNPQIQGPNAASQGVLDAVYRNRKYSAAAYKDASGKYSANERVLYNKAAVDAERQQHLATNAYNAQNNLPTLGAFDEYKAIDQHALRIQNVAANGNKTLKEGINAQVNTIEVTGNEERKEVPRQIIV